MRDKTIIWGSTQANNVQSGWGRSSQEPSEESKIPMWGNNRTTTKNDSWHDKKSSSQSFNWGNSEENSDWKSHDIKVPKVNWNDNSKMSLQSVESSWGNVDIKQDKDESKQTSSGWGQTGSGWGNVDVHIINPFQSNQNKSENPAAPYDLFSIKPPASPIEFNFGTGEVFKSNKNPDESFDTFISIPSTFNLPKPPPQAKRETKEVPLLPEVESKTGEEEDEIIFNEKAKAFALKDDGGKKIYSEVGMGELHFSKNKDTGIYRITMRRDQHNVFINTRIFSEMHPLSPQKAHVRLLASDPETGKCEIKLVKFEKEEHAKKLIELINDAIKKLK